MFVQLYFIAVVGRSPAGSDGVDDDRKHLERVSLVAAESAKLVALGV